MEQGRYNIAAGLATLGFFMAYGFFLIYMRDFHPNKAQWIAEYAVGKHFESRLAHVHGNLLALLNILLGFIFLKLQGGEKPRKIAAWMGLIGLLMPLGILGEVYFNMSPIFVLVGAASMLASVVFTAWLSYRFWPSAQNASSP
ncbi:hypothetical protein L6R29_17495 [Myxococcota bacterium]|nr:hypothetical protein [Myxococcota bacterium]